MGLLESIFRAAHERTQYDALLKRVSSMCLDFAISAETILANSSVGEETEVIAGGFGLDEAAKAAETVTRFFDDPTSPVITFDAHRRCADGSYNYIVVVIAERRQDHKIAAP